MRWGIVHLFVQVDEAGELGHLFSLCISSSKVDEAGEPGGHPFVKGDDAGELGNLFVEDREGRREHACCGPVSAERWELELRPVVDVNLDVVVLQYEASRRVHGEDLTSESVDLLASPPHHYRLLSPTVKPDPQRDVSPEQRMAQSPCSFPTCISEVLQ